MTNLSPLVPKLQKGGESILDKFDTLARKYPN
jgi:hypothetical protein